MVKLSKELMEILENPDSIKILTTIDEKGNPHSVVKGSLVALDEENLGYVEMIERSSTYRNILRNHWDKKLVSISIYNSKERVSYQVKGEPYRCVRVGPLWNQFLEKVWEKFPESDPACVWMIKPKEVINEGYLTRKSEQEERVKTQHLWCRFQGIRNKEG